jgi:hypothetical protein
MLYVRESSVTSLLFQFPTSGTIASILSGRWLTVSAPRTFTRISMASFGWLRRAWAAGRRRLGGADELGHSPVSEPRQPTLLRWVSVRRTLSLLEPNLGGMLQDRLWRSDDAVLVIGGLRGLRHRRSGC